MGKLLVDPTNFIIGLPNLDSSQSLLGNSRFEMSRNKIGNNSLGCLELLLKVRVQGVYWLYISAAGVWISTTGDDCVVRSSEGAGWIYNVMSKVKHSASRVQPRGPLRARMLKEL